jgi:hypothetical protein
LALNAVLSGLLDEREGGVICILIEAWKGGPYRLLLQELRI